MTLVQDFEGLVHQEHSEQYLVVQVWELVVARVCTHLVN